MFPGVKDAPFPCACKVRADFFLFGFVYRFDDIPFGVELYNHTLDDGSSFDGDFDVVNEAANPVYAPIRAQLAALLRRKYFNNSA